METPLGEVNLRYSDDPKKAFGQAVENLVNIYSGGEANMIAKVGLKTGLLKGAYQVAKQGVKVGLKEGPLLFGAGAFGRASMSGTNFLNTSFSTESEVPSQIFLATVFHPDGYGVILYFPATMDLIISPAAFSNAADFLPFPLANLFPLGAPTCLYFYFPCKSTSFLTSPVNFLLSNTHS